MTILSENLQSVTSADYAASLLREDLTGLDHEENWALYLNRANRPIGKMMVTCGTISSTLMDKRRIVKNALLHDATGIILFHNHPSGNPLPSPHDIEETDALKKCCDLFEIALLDHIIISDRRYFSFANDSIHNL